MLCRQRGGGQGRGYLNLSSPDVKIFDCRLGRKRLSPNICFALPRFTHPPYGLERSGNHKGQREQAKAEWISLFCLQISFFQDVFDQLNLLRYYGIKVNGSKEKPSRFLQVQLINVWLIRYNHCKLIKLTFFIPFTKNGIFKLTKCGLSPKGFCILHSVTRIMVKTYNCSYNRNMYLR